MTLDLSIVARQVAAMAERAPWRDDSAGHDLVQSLLRTTDPVALRQRIGQARTSWLVARLEDTLAARWPCPALPRRWTVLATDGSSMPPDRHSPLLFHLLNIGRVRLAYGPDADAAIDATATLCFDPKETHIELPDRLQRLPVDGARLAAKRTVRELAELASLAEAAPAPAIAMQDGTLILWALQSEDRAVQEWALAPLLVAAERVRHARVPLVGFISAPASTDVVNALRVAYCPHVPDPLPKVECERCPSRGQPDGPACNAVPQVTDRWLFSRLLEEGDRSDLFYSSSKVLERYIQADLLQEIGFFYLHTGYEIARIELPRWAAEQPGALDLIHGVVLDQVRRGDGYPPALQEAHEAAVIQAPERRLVEHLVDEALANAGLTMTRSTKDASKRLRAV